MCNSFLKMYSVEKNGIIKVLQIIDKIIINRGVLI